MNRLLLVASSVLVVLAAAGCGSKDSPSASPRATTVATEAAGVRDLHDIDELRSAFNARQGQPRLILIISPT